MWAIIEHIKHDIKKKQKNITLNRLDELKQLLGSFPSNINKWHEYWFSLSEETPEQNLSSICDALPFYIKFKF